MRTDAGQSLLQGARTFRYALNEEAVREKARQEGFLRHCEQVALVRDGGSEESPAQGS